MKRYLRMMLAVGVLIVYGPVIGTIVEASNLPSAVTVDVDDVNHVITITGRITLYPRCSAAQRVASMLSGGSSALACGVAESVRSQIQQQIESVWNQNKMYDCYKVVIKADVTVDNQADPSTESPDRVMVGVNQNATSFTSHIHGAPYPSGHKFEGNGAEDRFTPKNAADEPSTFSYPPVDSGNTVNVYAHEFGHIMGLDDSYVIGEDSDGNKVKDLRPGMEQDLMFASMYSNIEQSTIDRLVERSGKLSHATTKCDYKIDQMVDWYHFTSVKCATPVGDWVLTLDGTRDIGGGVVYVLTGSGLITLTDNGTSITGPWDAQYNTSVEGIPVSIGGQNGHLSGDAEFVKPKTLNLVTTQADADYYASNPYASRSGPAADPSRPITFTVINDHFC